jgi:hypothetical protein
MQDLSAHPLQFGDMLPLITPVLVLRRLWFQHVHAGSWPGEQQRPLQGAALGLGL